MIMIAYLGLLLALDIELALTFLLFFLVMVLLFFLLLAINCILSGYSCFQKISIAINQLYFHWDYLHLAVFPSFQFAAFAFFVYH